MVKFSMAQEKTAQLVENNRLFAAGPAALAKHVKLLINYKGEPQVRPQAV